ncbi:MAG TPA: bifunctional 4-hydroxy-2-oxoglutarate aldolase/2-dehydro-3-deoxy-phosphogluconate aldolase [Victivallales bacterium]|nr:bifunctional 4-hydroxy-2-oxoglutarate aldolase/2-dehydro-3-deoxy-phosphogluconate aldolase [Victivallales bacterium]
MYDEKNFERILKENPVVPVVAIENASDALPLCEILVANGINIIEITLRTSAAVKAITSVINSNLKICMGAGTVCDAEQFKMVENLGVDFVVSPGTTDELIDYAAKSSVSYLPGVMTSSEILKLRNFGFKFLKLFPATVAGGLNALKAYGSVYGDVKFCPTGGINKDNFIEYLNMKNVCAVGGTWIAGSRDIGDHNWTGIKNNASDIITKLEG